MRQAFRDLGHDAWSCDLLPAEDASIYHIKGDCLDAIESGAPLNPGESSYWMKPWDLMIAHPPCTHLAVSGSRHFPDKRLDGRQQEAIEFFLKLARAPIPRIAIENPVCIMSSIWRKPDQTIQPWMFGCGETKATCLWLKGLPHLAPTNIVPGRFPRVHLMPPSADRWKERSRTYEGIAKAMAEQWGEYADLVTMAEAE
ncbi:MAG TPA: DNA cytosine methyltransferase [Acidovorax sp.]|nr:DNA cytosine methyltransferase [Acidovorax sp.]